MTQDRRTFLTTTLATTTAAYFAAEGRAQAAAPSQAAAWDQLPKILARIKPPVFAKRDFDITKYGAAAGQATDSTDAIAKAIDACNKAGGGRVVVPAGNFYTGAIHLRSNVNLYLSAGATLKFIPDPKKYLPVVFTRYEGTELMNYSPFIYADGQENLGITGEGTLDGQCSRENWWSWVNPTSASAKPWGAAVAPKVDDRTILTDMGNRDVPVKERIFGEGHFLRPTFIQPCRSKNILIDGITILNSPMWEVTPLYCTNVTVRNVKIDSHGPNNDGCDPDSCIDVLIDNCSFSTGDDCIAIKSGRNRDGRRVASPTENVVIRNCDMKDGHGGLTIGSEMSAGVRNVFVENCRLNSPNLNEALRFKTNAMRGGTIENVYFRNITIGEVSDAILQVDFYYQEGDKGPERPVVRNIDIRDVTSKKSKYALQLRGFPDAPMNDIHFERCVFENVAKDDIAENVRGLTMTDVKVNGKAARPPA
jgi:polygalacturonase